MEEHRVSAEQWHQHAQQLEKQKDELEKEFLGAHIFAHDMVFILVLRLVGLCLCAYQKREQQVFWYEVRLARAFVLTYIHLLSLILLV